MRKYEKLIMAIAFVLVSVAVTAQGSRPEFVVHPVIAESETMFFGDLGQWLRAQGKNTGAEAVALFASRGPAFGYGIARPNGANFIVFPAFQAGLSGFIDVDISDSPGKRERVAVLSADYETGLALAAWPASLKPTKKGAGFAEIRIVAPQALQSGGIRSVPVTTIQKFVERETLVQIKPNSQSLQTAAISVCRAAALKTKPHFPLSEWISDSYALKYGVSMLKEALPSIDDDVKTDIFSGLETVFPLRGVKRAIAALIVLNYLKETGDVLVFREIPEATDMSLPSVTVYLRGRTEAFPTTWTVERGEWKLEKISLRRLVPSEPIRTPGAVLTEIDFSPPYQAAYLGFASIGTDPLAPLVFGGMLELPAGGSLMMRISGGGGIYTSLAVPQLEDEGMIQGGYQVDYRLSLSWGGFSLIPYATAGGTASVSFVSGNLVPLAKYGAGVRFKFGDDPRIVVGIEACRSTLIVSDGTPPSLWVFSLYGGLADY